MSDSRREHGAQHCFADGFALPVEFLFSRDARHIGQPSGIAGTQGCIYAGLRARVRDDETEPLRDGGCPLFDQDGDDVIYMACPKIGAKIAESCIGRPERSSCRLPGCGRV